jgi:hypothetical protein
MNNIKIELFDNDHVLRARMEVPSKGNNETISTLLRTVKEEFIAGETAFLEIEGANNKPITFEISHLE